MCDATIGGIGLGAEITKKDIALMYDMLSKDYQRLADDFKALSIYLLIDHSKKQLGEDKNDVERVGC